MATIKSLIEEFAKHSREYQNPREDVTRGNVGGDGGQDNLALLLGKLDSMDRRTAKMRQSIHVIQV